MQVGKQLYLEVYVTIGTRILISMMVASYIAVTTNNKSKKEKRERVSMVFNVIDEKGMGKNDFDNELRNISEITFIIVN